MSLDRERLPAPADYFAEAGNPLRGPGKWKTARCDFHGGSDSLRVNSQTGTWVCMNCHGRGGDVLAHHMANTGVDFVTACKQLGAWVADGRPAPTRPLPVPARQLLALVASEAQLVAIVASDAAAHRPIQPLDAQRCQLAAGRIQHIADLAQ